MPWLMLMLYYVMILGLSLVLGACAYRPSQQRHALSRTIRTLSQGWKPISFLLGARSSQDETHKVSRLHVIVLVHGWLGNPSEMGYLKHSLYRSVLTVSRQDVTSTQDVTVHSHNPIALATFTGNQTQAFVIHSAECNSGSILTSDGIAAGGERLAEEIDALISHYAKQCGEEDCTHSQITLSLVGNSLGGLYARYAISRMNTLDMHQGTSSLKVSPKFFVTTCTPHLGVSNHTFIKIPTWVEAPIARIMQQTGLDLFRRTDVIQDMTVKSEFLQPLVSFPRKLALANVYGTDFQVPTATAAFLANTDSIHEVVRLEEPQSCHNIVLQLQTPQEKHLSEYQYPSPKQRLSDAELSIRLDRLGWKKVLVDVRQHMPFTGRVVRSTDCEIPGERKRLVEKSLWTAEELLQEFDRGHFRHVPLGHTVMVANSKDRLNIYLTQGGKATMDYLADTMIRGLLEE